MDFVSFELTSTDESGCLTYKHTIATIQLGPGTLGTFVD